MQAGEGKWGMERFRATPHRPYLSRSPAFLAMSGDTL
jgi:hypothetical protein